MTERWQKVCDTPAPQRAVGGMVLPVPAHANAGVVDGSEVLGRGQGQGYMEIALEQAEKARAELADDNAALRALVVHSLNRVKGVVSDYNDDIEVRLVFRVLFVG